MNRSSEEARAAESEEASSSLSSSNTSLANSSPNTETSQGSSSNEAANGRARLKLNGSEKTKGQLQVDRTKSNMRREASAENKSSHQVGSAASVKRYKNSPFGLKRHYLSMPDDGQPQKANIYSRYNVDRLDDLDPTDEDENEHERRVEERESVRINKSNDRGQEQALSSDQSCHDLSPSGKSNHCDLSVLASSAGSLSPAWNGFNRRHQSQPKQTQPPDSASLSQFHRSRPVLPAGDAGLDAKRCNAKDSDQEDYCCDVNPNDPDLHAQKLKLAELDRSKGSSGLLIRFSSIMYATFLVILGCILHVAELRQKSKNSSDHIYTTIVASIGIIWLMFLQTDLQRYKRYASKYILIESIFNDHRQRSLEAQRREVSRPVDPTARSTTSSSASLVNDRMSMNTEVIFKKTAYKMYQQQAALDRQRGNNNHNHRVLQPSKIKSPVTSDSSDGCKPARGTSLKDSLSGDEAVERDPLVPAYKFLHGKMGANFYLKCGMAAFCFGHVIHEGLRFGQQVYFFGTGNTHCRDSAALVAHLVTPLYSFYQLFMMFKYSNLVINRHKVLARFGLMHIIGTSVTFWFRTILEEAFEDFVHKMDYFKTNKPQMDFASLRPIQNETNPNLASILASVTKAIDAEASERSDWSFSSSGQNASIAQSLLALMSSPISATITPQMVRHLPDSYACAQNTLLTTKSMNALPYLYPFTIEYNLLLAATFLSLYFNIGKIGVAGAGDTVCGPAFSSNHANMIPRYRSLSNSPGSHIESSDNSSASRMRDTNHGNGEFGEYKSNFVVNADCHSANKGLFCGFFVLLVTLVTIVIFFVTINKPTHIQLGIKINLIQEATLTALILIVTLAGFKQVVKLNRNPYLKDKVTTDDVLMLIPLPFFFIHSLLSFRAETASMSSGRTSQGSPTLMHENHQLSPLAALNGNLRSILSGANLNGTQPGPRSSLNNLMAGNPNETGGRFVEDFISNSNSSSDRNGRNISSIDVGGNSSHIDHFKLITVALNIIVMIEVLVQTNFIIDGMRRCSESRYLRFKKPGRELITFAILLNITYWIVATFETKSVEQYKTEIEYYGPLPYMFISHTTLPVMLFYRYHSSVCLAEIWNRAYKPPKKR